MDLAAGFSIRVGVVCILRVIGSGGAMLRPSTPRNNRNPRGVAILRVLLYHGRVLGTATQSSKAVLSGIFGFCEVYASLTFSEPTRVPDGPV